jgi:hypothetical protein
MIDSKYQKNVSDITTKFSLRYIHKRQTKNRTNGQLDIWKEDVKNDNSVVEFGKSQVDVLDEFLDNNHISTTSL